MKRARSIRKNGIVLVTVLFLTILISMFIGSAILVGPRTLGLADSEDGALTATAAAESGMQYAIMKVRENPEWRGNGTGITTPDFTVVEDSGYVWGYMKAADGSASMFRIRFNYEDGNGGPDKLNNSAGPRIQTQYVSINNLFNSNSSIVPRASNDTQSTVVDPNTGDYEVPPYAICLIVEGMAGPAIRNFDSNDPNPKGYAQTKILEATYVASNLNDVATDAAAMSNANLEARVEGSKAFTVESKDGSSPAVRSRGTVKVRDESGAQGKYVSEDGTVFTGSGALDADYSTSTTTVEQEDSSNPFYELTWDELKTADPAGPNLPAGTYVWWDDGSLHYYEMDYADYRTWVKNPLNTSDAGQVIYSGGNYASGFTPPDNLEIFADNSKRRITITGDLYISPVPDGLGGNKAEGIAVIPREGAPEEPPGQGQGQVQAQVAGPALAQFLAQNPLQRQGFFAAMVGDGSNIGNPVAGADEGWHTAGGPGADLAWKHDGSQVFFDVQDYPGPQGLQDAMTDAFSQTVIPTDKILEYAASYGLIDDNDSGDLDLNTGDSTTADDLDFQFDPPEGSSATLSSEGDVLIGAKLKGQGASITSGGTLKVIGAGADLSAVANAEDGVNMYAKGDITLSTLKEKNGGYEFKDIKLKGLVYTWGDFEAKMGNDDPGVKKGKLQLEGTLVAYGGDPANGIPTNNSKGKVTIDASEVKLKFNPAYLLGVMQTLPNNIEFTRAAWTSYK